MTNSAGPIQDLASWNKSYEERFGFIFIICASGKSAAEMLAAVKARRAVLSSPWACSSCTTLRMNHTVAIPLQLEHWGVY